MDYVANPQAAQLRLYATLRFAFLSLRASRYLRIFAFGTSLCFAQTMPKTDAAVLLQPGTGQSCLGAFLRVRKPGGTAAFGFARRPDCLSAPAQPRNFEARAEIVAARRSSRQRFRIGCGSP